MKLTSVKSMMAKGVTVGLLAGAIALAAPAKAEAQQFAIGVQFGSPAYGYVAPGDYYARQRYEEYCRQQARLQHEAFVRQQAWVRQHAYAYRDNDWRDHDDHRDWDHR
jgi:hypothetical protein